MARPRTRRTRGARPARPRRRAACRHPRARRRAAGRPAAARREPRAWARGAGPRPARCRRAVSRRRRERPARAGCGFSCAGFSPAASGRATPGGRTGIHASAGLRRRHTLEQIASSGRNISNGAGRHRLLAASGRPPTDGSRQRQ